MANSGHCWVLDDLAIERIMKGRMSCWPADGGGGGWPQGWNCHWFKLSWLLIQAQDVGGGLGGLGRARKR